MTSEGVNGTASVEIVPEVPPQATGGGKNKKLGNGLADTRHLVFTATSVSSSHYPRSHPKSIPSSDISCGLSGYNDSIGTHTKQDEVVEGSHRDKSISSVSSSRSSLRGILGNDTDEGTFVTQSLPATLKLLVNIEPPIEPPSTSSSRKLLQLSQGTPSKDTGGTFVTRSLPATLPSSKSLLLKSSRSSASDLSLRILEKWLVKPETVQDTALLHHPTHSNGGKRLGQYVLQSLQVQQFDSTSKYVTGFSVPPLRRRSTTTISKNEFDSFVCPSIDVRTRFFQSGSLIPSDID